MFNNNYIPPHPTIPIAPHSSLTKKELPGVFQFGAQELSNGKPFKCPRPTRKECSTPFNPSYPAAYVKHCREAHDIAALHTTIGRLACGLLHSATGEVCGYRFDSLGNMKHHMGGMKYCHGGWIPPKNCCLLVLGSTVCIKSFTSVSLLLRHQSSKFHGGDGVRSSSGPGVLCSFVS